MEIKQLKLSKMSLFSYLVCDSHSKTCALIDPAFDVEKILSEVENVGYVVTYIINTHGHADHITGNASIKDATRAKLLIHELDAFRLRKLFNRIFSRLLGGKGSPEADILLKDGDVIEIGETTLKVIHTPGHTEGSICLYAEGHLFTGDTLFVGSVGRTDLSGGSSKILLRSIRERIFSLPIKTLVWPGHNYGSSPYSTIEQEIKTNPFTR